MFAEYAQCIPLDKPVIPKKVLSFGGVYLVQDLIRLLAGVSIQCRPPICELP